MAISIQFYNQTDEVIDRYQGLIRKVVEETIKQEKLAQEKLECSYIFVDNEQIRQLNLQYRQKNAVTDVITFAVEDHLLGTSQIVGIPLQGMLGDIFISLPRAREQAKQYRHSLERELSFLAVHGFLHLLGYDHFNKDEEKIMFAKQEAVLNELGTRR